MAGDGALMRYLHGGKMRTRNPEAVDPALLPEVLRVVAVAGRSCAAARFPAGDGT